VLRQCLRRTVCCWSRGEGLVALQRSLLQHDSLEAVEDAVDVSWHLALPLWATRGKRIVIVGDVHGCADELVDLMNEVQFDSGKDILVFVGDLVAKGPKSKEVVQFAIEARALGVRGNHDHYTILRRDDDRDPQKEHSKLAREVLSKNEMDWLAALPLSLRIEEHNVLVVHAGLKPSLPIEKNDMHDILHIRNITEDGSASSNPNRGIPWVEAWKGPEHVVFGHDAVRKIQSTQFSTGLDSGCVYGGELSALIVPSFEVKSVKARKTYKFPGRPD